ncbi:MAG: hypothetical protein FWC36_07810 [Spirochaetes bacterium]|nr:hypothetical protein [Spirochaetota bacterium]
MKRFKYLVFVLIFCFTVSAFAQQTQQAPGTTPSVFIPDPDAVALNRAVSLNDREFIYYAFRFSGVTRENAETFVRKYEALAENLAAHLRTNNINPANHRQTGEAILIFLHDNLLRRYVEKETRLNELFNRGVFNCVSSAIIYYALAMRNNLDVRAIRTKDHAFCALIIDGEIVDVETTNRHGFDPGEKREFIDAFGRMGFVYTPPSNHKDRFEISAKELLSLVLQNRIAELQHRGNFMDTVSLAVDRNAVLGTDASFAEMINEFRNHSVQLSNRGADGHRNAINFLSSAALVYGFEPVLTNTAGKLFHNQIARDLNQNRLTQAQNFFSYFEPNPIIPSEVRQETFILISQKELQLFIQNNEFAESRRKTFEHFNQNLLNNTDKINYLVFVYSREVNRLSNSSDWVKAIEIVRQGIEEIGRDSRMLRLEEAVKHNIGVVYHNRFAAYFNRGDRAAAAAVLEEGLSIVPDNRMLLQNRERLRRE